MCIRDRPQIVRRGDEARALRGVKETEQAEQGGCQQDAGLEKNQDVYKRQVLDQLGAALEKIVNSQEFQEFAASKAMIAEFIPRDQWIKYYQACLLYTSRCV